MSSPSPSGSSRSGSSRHRPVMPREVIEQLDLSPGLTVLDGTAGGGGHSSLIWERIAPNGRLIGLDRDPVMIAHAVRRFEPLAADRVSFHESSYRDAQEILTTLSLATVDRVLVDLGLSSDQLADDDRGFGFDSTGPLDLRFDPSRGRPAHQWIAEESINSIEQVLTEYGEEPHAAAIAKALHDHPPTTAADLTRVVTETVPSGGRTKGRGKHPATRVFQALRIAVNDELDHLKTALSDTFPALLPTGGRLVAIAFHSLEDRILKLAFQGDPAWRSLTKKPILPSPTEIRTNPRSRSARIRSAVRN